MKDFKKTTVIMFILCFALFVNCKKKSNSTSTPGPNEVFMQNTAFTPASITVPVNTTIKWTNKDNMNHNVTNSSFQSGTIGAGGTYSHQFTTAGTFTYVCTFHSGMNGTVIVQ